MNTHDFDLRLTNHACKIAAKKGFKPQDIHDAFYHPESVEPVETHPGQYRVAGKGMAFIGVPQESKFLVITCGKA